MEPKSPDLPPSVEPAVADNEQPLSIVPLINEESYRSYDTLSTRKDQSFKDRVRERQQSLGAKDKSRIALYYLLEAKAREQLLYEQGVKKEVISSIRNEPIIILITHNEWTDNYASTYEPDYLSNDYYEAIDRTLADPALEPTTIPQLKEFARFLRRTALMSEMSLERFINSIQMRQITIPRVDPEIKAAFDQIHEDGQSDQIVLLIKKQTRRSLGFSSVPEAKAESVGEPTNKNPDVSATKDAGALGVLERARNALRSLRPKGK